MSQTYHFLSSSGEESDDSLPDLQTRIKNKLSKPLVLPSSIPKTSPVKPSQPPKIHTLSSSEDDEKDNDVNGKKSPSGLHTLSSSDDDICNFKGSFSGSVNLNKNKNNEINEQDDEIDIVKVIKSPVGFSKPATTSMNFKGLYYMDDGIDVVKVVKSPVAFSKPATNPLSFKGLNHTDPFEEELPDIKDFTILTGGLDYGNELKENIEEESPLKLAPKKLKAEEVQNEKEAKRKQREVQKEQKALEKAELKAQKEAERTSRNAMKPGECLKYVKVQLDRHLLESPEGSHVISHLQLAGLQYEIIDSPIPYVASVVRINPLTLQTTLAEDAVLIIPIKEFLELVERQVYYNGVSGLCEQCRQWKMGLGIPRLTLVIAGIDKFLRGKKTDKNRDFRNTIRGETSQPKRKKTKVNANGIASNVTRVDIETALVMAQIECNVNHRLISDAEKIAAFVVHLTKALAEAPLKREKMDSSTFSWYAEGSSVKTVKVDKSGVGLLKLWRQQLQQFNNVGPELAQAIVREYPSPQALVQAYKHMSEKEAALLLADIPVRRGNGPLASTRRIGPELSKKVHIFFTCTDPELNLGQKT